MFRVVPLSLVVFLSVVFPAQAQQPVAPEPSAAPSALSILASALKSGQAKIRQESKDHYILSGEVDIPLQGGITIFADEVNLHFDTSVLPWFGLPRSLGPATG